MIDLIDIITVYPPFGDSVNVSTEEIRRPFSGIDYPIRRKTESNSGFVRRKISDANETIRRP